MRPPVIITLEIFAAEDDIATIRALVLDRLNERPLNGIEHVIVT